MQCAIFMLHFYHVLFVCIFFVLLLILPVIVSLNSVLNGLVCFNHVCTFVYVMLYTPS